jgi:hypothetical protein
LLGWWEDVGLPLPVAQIQPVEREHSADLNIHFATPGQHLTLGISRFSLAKLFRLWFPLGKSK